MKLRAGHIVLLAVALIGGFVVFAVMWEPGPDETLSRDERVLREAQERAAGMSLADGAVGSIMPGGTEAGSPRIGIPESVDVGLMPNDALGRYDLTVTNEGNLPLHLQQVTTSCECTRGVLPEGGMKIEPGGEGMLQIVIDPYRIPAFEATRTLTVKSNDPLEPFKPLEVTSRIEPELSLEPERVDFGTVQKGENPTITVRLKQLRDEDVVLDEVSQKTVYSGPVDTNELDFEWERLPESAWSTPGKAEYDIHVTLTPDAPVGSTENMFYIMNNVERIKILPVKFSVTVEAPYTVDPPIERVLGVPNMPDTRGVITVRGPEGIAVANPEVDPEAYTVTVREEDEPRAAYLEVVMVDTVPPGPVREELWFDIILDGVTYRERVRAHGKSMNEAPLPTAQPQQPAVSLDNQ